MLFQIECKLYMGTGFVALYIVVSLRFKAVSGTPEKGPK